MVSHGLPTPAIRMSRHRPLTQLVAILRHSMRTVAIALSAASSRADMFARSIGRRCSKKEMGTEQFRQPNRSVALSIAEVCLFLNNWLLRGYERRMMVDSRASVQRTAH